MAADNVTLASKMPFFELCRKLEKIEKTQVAEQRKRILKTLMDDWRSQHNSLHKDDPHTTDSFYPVMRLLLPALERERDAYGIKEKKLAMLYIDLLQLGKTSPSAEKLLNYRAPTKNAGDFANMAYGILESRCPPKGTMTVEEVNNCLNDIAKKNAAKDKKDFDKSMRHMIMNMTAKEQKWLIRMILKDMRIGMSQATILGLFHQDAEDLYNVKMSLEKVCTMLRDPKVRLHEVEITVMSPFRPMLGDRGSPNKIEQMMDNRPFFIETKFDGERMQLHKNGDEYKYFSRSGHDYTSTYGSNQFDPLGIYTEYIANCFKPHIKNCILDGEMVGYNPEDKTIGSKGENFDIKSAKVYEKGYQPMLCAFDILLLNDEVLSNKPLRERKKILETVFVPVEGRINISEYKEGKTRQDCADALNEAIDMREEGIMVKDPESPYKPAARKGGWFKIKPEYVGGLMDELDLLVVGGMFGSGSRAASSSNLASHFLCAVAKPPDEGETPTEFHTICRIGSGYTRKELLDFNKRLEDQWDVFNKKKPPKWLKMPAGFKQLPDIIIKDPTKSFILQIKAAEITSSDQYMTGCTLRFPRVEKIRYDKAWHECMTTKDIEDLRAKSSGKLFGHVHVDAEDDEPVKKKRKVTTRYVKPTVMARFRGVDTSKVTKISEMLAGKEICVINGSATHPKSDLEKKIVEFGGTIVQNAGDETFCVLADKLGLRVKNLIATGKFDVVKVEWLLKCVENSRIIPWVPSDMVYTTTESAKEFALSYDQNGDSYYEDTTVDELKRVFQKIEEKGSATKITVERIAEIEMDYFPTESLLGLFRLCKVHMDTNMELGKPDTHIKSSSLELTALEMRFHGATLLETLDETVSHVVIHSSDLRRVQELREENKARGKKFHIVTADWVKDCIEQEKLLKERLYEPRL